MVCGGVDGHGRHRLLYSSWLGIFEPGLLESCMWGSFPGVSQKGSSDTPCARMRCIRG